MTVPQIDTGLVLLGIVIVLVSAKLGEVWARRLGLPQVLGELSMGILLGNVYLFSGWQFFNFIGESPFLRVLGDLGAMTLLLAIGLRTDLGAMSQVGISALLVAMLGIIVPAGLGFFTCQLLIPDTSIYTRSFLIAALCVNSVGIAIRVFMEFGRLDTSEARIVIAATLLDAILIFLIVGVLGGMIQAGHLSEMGALMAGGQAVLFLLFIGVISLRYGREIGFFITEKFPENLKVFAVVVMCLFLAYLAGVVRVSPIVGAFGAGLLLHNVRSRDSNGSERGMEELIRPAYWILVPIFFVLLGTGIRLESFFDKEAVLLGLAVTVVAVLGKLAAGLGVIESGVNRLWVGMGMVPRAEMALTVASMGETAKILDPMACSAIIIMTVITSLFGPPFLKRLLFKTSVKVNGEGF